MLTNVTYADDELESRHQLRFTLGYPTRTILTHHQRGGIAQLGEQQTEAYEVEF